jgi:hypothetical protein
VQRMKRLVTAAACAGALAAGFPLRTVDAAGPALRWSIQATPNPAGATAAILQSVSCSSRSACTAVGYWVSVSDPSPSALVERWDGATWSIQPTSTPRRSTVNLLSSVSCPTARLCLAVGLEIVGSNVDRGLSETWTGSHWTVVPIAAPPNAAGSDLAGVSCSSSTSCVAVGSYVVGNQQHRPLAEVWNGTVWAVAPMPNPHAENGSNATAVSCIGATACMATAEYAFGDVDQSIYSLRWDGGSWARAKQPNPKGQFANFETSASCSSVSACTSIGFWTDNGPLALAERWNGTRWVRQPVPRPRHSVQSAFGGVSCATDVVCMAVGTSSASSNSIPTTTLAERWEDAVWTVVPTPNPSGAEFSTLAGVACPSPTFCVAVGDAYNSATRTDSSLAEAYSR